MSADEGAEPEKPKPKSKTAPEAPPKAAPKAEPVPSVGTRFSAEEIHENVLEAADEELERPLFELWYSGLASGLTIAFSFLSVAVLQARMGEVNHAIASAIAYPIGFIYVVLARHQLFTENTLEPVVPVLERRDLNSLMKMLRLWGIVLFGNLIGAAIVGLVIARTQVLEPSVDSTLMSLARKATDGGALIVFYKAIWAGWLIALMAWMLASTHETIAQIALIWLTTAPIGAFGFRHSIAGAVEAFYRVWNGDWGFGSMLASYELPALLGNIVGGVVLVALVNHGQVGSKQKRKREQAA